MQTLRNYFKNLKVQNSIEDILSIKQLHFIKDKYFRNLIASVNFTDKSNASRIAQIFRGLFSKYRLNQKQILRVLMIIHQILRETNIFEVSDALIQELFQFCLQLKQVPEDQLEGIDVYLKKSFTTPYATYLIKAFRKQGKEEFVQNRNLKRKDSFKRNQSTGHKIETKKTKLSSEIKMDFSLFNMVNDIIKLNGDLHQMGRFYPNHQYVINIYMEMLKDFQLYFEKIRTIFNELIHLKKHQIEDGDAQHIYLYLSESERCVNKMNSFYYNKYLYYYVNDKIVLEMQLEIPRNFYGVLNKSSHSHRKLSFDYSLTMSFSGNKTHLSDTTESNRYKLNDVSKIVHSISCLNQTLKQIQNIQKTQQDLELQPYLTRSTIF